MIKIAMLDDHYMVLQGLEGQLSQHQEIEVIGSYTDVTEFLLCLKTSKIDIAILDYRLGKETAFDVIDKIELQSSLAPKVIVLTGFYDKILHKRALEKGVKAFLRKETSMSELLSTIELVQKNNILLPDDFLPVEHMSILTDTELNVLRLMVEEYTNEKIGQELFISRRTVENHVSSICRKLGVNGRIGAVREAIRLNLINNM